MLNLLNREKRYFLRREYFGRVANIFLGILVFCLVFYGVLLISNGFLVSFEKTAVENEAKNISESTLQKDLTEYEDRLAHIEAEYKLFSKEIIYPTEIISLIKEKEILGITLNAIIFQKIDEKGNIKLEIRGVAKNRDILINYLNSFKKEEIFKDVTVPLSSLAKNSDIPFTFSVNTKIDKKWKIKQKIA